MDISNIQDRHAEVLALAYQTVPDIFGSDPMNAPPKKQKEIRKWVEKVYISDGEFPPEVMAFIGKDVSDGDFMAFLQACHDRVEQRNIQDRQLFEERSADLDQDVRSALWELLDAQAYCHGFQKSGSEVRLQIDCCEAFDRFLILTDPEGLPDVPFDRLIIEQGSFSKEGSTYGLSGEAVNDEDDTETPFTLRFTGGRIAIAVYRADLQVFFSTPWKHLISIASEILDKSELPGDHLNEKEKELLPLIVELSKLSRWNRIPEEHAASGLPLLKGFARRQNCTELLPLIEKLELSFSDDEKKHKLTRKLTSRLNRIKYEPLWRELYGLLSDSQECYPTKADVCVPGDLLAQTREDIQRLLESHGYSGTYPDFEKRGPIRGVRLAGSYGMDYFVTGEKNTVFRIHCIESFFNGHLMIEFLCGTELLRKNEQPGDIFSCTFDAKGRRLFQTVTYEHGADAEADDPELRVRIAVKRAELQRLTKEEHLAIYGYTGGFWTLFLAFLVLGGGLSALLFTPGMMLFCAIITAIFAGFAAIPDMLTAVPWWEMFGMAWVLFGGAMGIVTALAARK